MSGQSQSSEVAMRIITTEHSLEIPLLQLDVTRSAFRRTNTKRVPVIHLFGATNEGKRMCMHVHGVFPYIYVPLEYDPEESYLHKLAQSVDKAINISLGRPDSYSQHVFNISVVHGIPYYGFHHKTSVFLKIYLYNPMLISRLADLLLSGAIMGRSYQPHEAHIPFILQFFIDYNLYGMNYINVSSYVKRDSPPEPEHATQSHGDSCDANPSGVADGAMHSASFTSPLYRVSTCDLEVDITAAEILNKQLIDDHVGANPGLLALWDEERKRLRLKGVEDEVVLEAPSSPERKDSDGIGVDSDWYERFLNMLDALDLANEEDKQSFMLPSSGETSSLDQTDLTEDVNEHSISQMLTFNDNLSEMARRMSCRKLASLLANQSDSEEEIISYSPKVSPVKGNVSRQEVIGQSFSPILSPVHSVESASDITLTPATAQIENTGSPGALSAASENRSLSVLSGSSFVSQASRKSKSSLYKWSNKWSQIPDSASTSTTYPTLSQTITDLVIQSPSMSQKDSQSQHISGSTDNSSRVNLLLKDTNQVLSQPASFHNTSLFSDDEEDSWLMADNSSKLQLTTGGFDKLYESPDDFSSSEDEDLETTLMSQPVWEGASDISDSELIPQLDGAHDEEEPIDSSSSLFQVSKQRNPLKLTLRKSISQSEQEATSQPLKMTFRRTSATTYANDMDVPSVHLSESDVNTSDQAKELSEIKPKITLSFKSLTQKMKDILPKKKKHKDKNKSHKRDKNKCKKMKDESDVNLCAEAAIASTPSNGSSAIVVSHTNISGDVEVPCVLPVYKMTKGDHTVEQESFIPKLTFAKKGKHFSIKKKLKVSPLKLKLSEAVNDTLTAKSLVEDQSCSKPKSSIEQSKHSACSVSLAMCPTQLTGAFSGSITTASDKFEQELALAGPHEDPLSASDTFVDKSGTNNISSQQTRLFASKSKPAIKMNRHGKFTVSRERVASVKTSLPVQKELSKSVKRTCRTHKAVSNKQSIRKDVSFGSHKGSHKADIASTSTGNVTKRNPRGLMLGDGHPEGDSEVRDLVTARVSEVPETDNAGFLPSSNLWQSTAVAKGSNAYDLNMHMSGQLLGNNTSVFPQPIPVVETKNNFHSDESHAKQESRESRTPKPSKYLLTATQRAKSVLSLSTTASAGVNSLPQTSTSAISVCTSPGPGFLESMNLKRVCDKPTGEQTGNLDISIQQSYSKSDTFSLVTNKPNPGAKHVSNIAPSLMNNLVSPSSAFSSATTKTISELGESSQSGLYNTFLKTKLGQKPVSRSPLSTGSSHESSASGGENEQRPVSCISSPGSIHSASALPTEPQESTSSTMPKISVGTGSHVSSLDKDTAVSIRNEQSTSSLASAPQVQHGFFRKKKIGKSKHSKTQRRPHGCRNVPQSLSKTTPLLTNSIKITNDVNLPSDTIENDYSKNPIRLKLKKLKSPTTNDIAENDFSTNSLPQETVSSHMETMIGPKNVSEEVIDVPNTVPKEQDHAKAAYFTSSAQECSESTLELNQPIIDHHLHEEPVDQHFSAQGSPKNTLEKIDCEVQSMSPTFHGITKSEQVDCVSAPDGTASEPDGTSLPKPRSFVDRLSQLSQVLGVAPSDRLPEDLPINLPPFVRRDKSGKRSKRGKGRSSGVARSVAPTTVKRMPQKKPTILIQKRSDRPKRMPNRFQDQTTNRLVQKEDASHASTQLTDKLPIVQVNTFEMPKNQTSVLLKKTADASEVQERKLIKNNRNTKRNPSSLIEPELLITEDQNRESLEQKQSPNDTTSLKSKDDSSNSSLKFVAEKHKANRLRLTSLRLRRRPQSSETVKKSAIPSLNKSKHCKDVQHLHNPEHVYQTRGRLAENCKFSGRRTKLMGKVSRHHIRQPKQIHDGAFIKSHLSTESSKVRDKHKQLVLRSSHLPSESDGRVTLTLRRSVLLQKDHNTEKPETQSPKSLIKRPKHEANPIFELQSAFEASYAFESDGYATRILLKDAKTLQPSVGLPLTKPRLSHPAKTTSLSISLSKEPSFTAAVSLATHSMGSNEATLSKPVSSTIKTRAKNSCGQLMAESANAVCTAKNHALSRLTPSKTRIASSRPSPCSLKKPNKVEAVRTAAITHHVIECSAPQKAVSKSISPANPTVIISEAKPVVSEAALKVIESHRLSTKPLSVMNQRNIAPKPQPALQNAPQSNMVIIIPTAPLPSTLAAHTEPSLNRNISSTSMNIPTEQLSIPQISTVTHGLQIPSDIISGKNSSYSKIQASPLIGQSDKVSGDVSGKLPMSTLKPVNQVFESDNQVQVTRTTKLRSTRAARNINGIMEDRALMLKRFLALPELTVENKRACVTPTSISDESAATSYCENANNDWQVAYDHALQSAALLSDDGTIPSQSVKVDFFNVGNSSYRTDDCQTDLDSISSQKLIADGCNCLDCSLSINAYEQNSTVMAQGLHSSESVSLVIHAEKRNTWSCVYNSWRSDDPNLRDIANRSDENNILRQSGRCPSSCKVSNISSEARIDLVREKSTTACNNTMSNRREVVTRLSKILNLELTDISPVLEKGSFGNHSIALAEFETVTEQLNKERHCNKTLTAEPLTNCVSLSSMSPILPPMVPSIIVPKVSTVILENSRAVAIIGVKSNDLVFADLFPKLPKVEEYISIEQCCTAIKTNCLCHINVSEQLKESLSLCSETKSFPNINSRDIPISRITQPTVSLSNASSFPQCSVIASLEFRAFPQVEFKNYEICELIDPDAISATNSACIELSHSAAVQQCMVAFELANSCVTDLGRHLTTDTRSPKALGDIPIRTAEEIVTNSTELSMASVISMECVKEESTFCAQLESAVAPLCDPAIHISQALFSWNDHPPNSFLASETFVRKLDASDSVHHSAIVKESNSLAGINLLEEVILVSCTSSTSILSKQSPSFAICFCNPETVAIQWHQCSSISSVNVAHPLVDGIYVQYENISNLKQSLNVICDDGMLPLNLSIKTPTTRWTTQESLPIDLSIRRKRSSPTPDPLNLSIKRRARMSEPALPFHSEHLPVAVKLEQHFGIVEGMSSSICENGETPEKQDAHLPRRASTSAASLFEHFTTSQTDGASDSPESSTQSGPGSAKSKSHLTQSEASFNALPSSPADIESDETLWSDDSMRGTNVYIIPGTPEELTQDDHALPDEGDKQAGQDMKRRNSFEGSEIEKEQSANVSTQLKHRPSELAESDSSSSSFTSIKRFKPNPVKETTTTKSEMKHYTFSRPPPLFEDVRSSAIDLGLALVDNVYPYFSNKSDCETALAEPMSRNCNKRFADRCLRHLPKVVMRHDPNEFDLASLHKIERHQYVKPPPSKKSVQRWLTHRKKETERLPLVTNQPTTSKTTSVVSPAAVADLDIVVPESPPTESHSRNKGSFTSSNPVSGQSKTSDLSECASSSSHYHLFDTRVIKSLNEDDGMSGRLSRRSAFADKPTDERSFLSHQSLCTSLNDGSSYSPLTNSQQADLSASVTAAWSGDESGIEGLSGRQNAAETHRVLKEMASHNTVYNDMVTMSMELHASTRGSLYPDPLYDRVEAIFLHVYHDTATKDTFHYVLILVDKCQRVPVFLVPGITVQVVECASEKHLLQELIQLVIKHDADLLVGWEVNNMSWGYLLRRSHALQVELANELSRIPKQSSNTKQSMPEIGEGTEFARVGGRVMVNMWRVMRHQMMLGLIPALTSYQFENVVYHTLNLRVPKFTFEDLTKWYNMPKKRQLVLDQYLRRVHLLHDMEQQIDFIGQTSEFARVYGIEFCDVVIKGTQYKVESMMLRIAKPLNFVAVSPNVQQRVRMNPPQCIQLTLEPESKFYADPVIVLDFQSLYPSIMIAYNYCFSTCLGHITELERAGGEEFKFGCTSLKVPGHVLNKLRGHINVSPNGVAFVKEHVRKGVISRMVEEILETRLMVKRCMARYKSDQGLHKLLHARQLGLKLIANVTFGYTAANFSGRMPCVEVGDSIIRKARETLERAIKLVNESERWNCRVVYGDTDSLFVLVPGRSLATAFKIGEEIRDAVTADNPKPVKLKLEKVYMGCVLQTKKRYAGYMYETADQKEPVFDAKGIETVRRDSVPAVSKILEKSLITLFASRDLSQVKLYVQKQLAKVLEGTAKLQDFIFAREYRGERGYKATAKVPSLLIARKRLALDRWSEPLTGDRVPYVIVCGAPGTPLYNLVREPHEVLANAQLKLNTLYYVTRVILPPLHRAFSLLGVNVQSWFEELPKSHKIGTVSTSSSVKSTLTQYFQSTSCHLCQGGQQAKVCYDCLTKDACNTVIALNSIVSRQHSLELAILQMCRCCAKVPDQRVPCISFDCPVLYKKTQLHNDRILAASLSDQYLGKINNF